MTLDIIAFDADDTLWHTEFLYTNVEIEVRQILQKYYPEPDLAERLHQVEIANLQYYGYGIKSFILSLIESCITVTDGKITGAEIHRVIELAKQMLSAEIRFMDHAVQAVEELSEVYPLMLITKGDLFEQDAKIVRSGLKPYFKYVEIVSDKDRKGYEQLFKKYDLSPEKFLMVGNSMRSDILPVIALGGLAVYIPYAGGWAHEDAPPPQNAEGRFFEIANLGQLPALIERLDL